MSRATRWFTLASCVLPFVLSAQPSSNASGSLTVNGAATQLRFAYAFHDAEAGATRVLVTASPLAPDALSAEIPLRDSRGESGLRSLVRDGKASAIELFVSDDGRMETVMVFDRGFPAPTPCSGDDSYWYEPYRMSDGWIGARSRTRQEQEFFDTRWNYEVAFFAPVGKTSFQIPDASALEARRKEIEAREKPRIVPAGGGEEGAAYLAFFKNLETGNLKAALETMTPALTRAVAERMDVPALSPTDLALWAMSLTTPPGKVEVVGGVRDPGATLLELRRTAGSRVEFGTARMVREGAIWKVDAQEW